MSLKALRALLGNSVRFSIDIDNRAIYDDDAPPAVAARWFCGCSANGSSFNLLSCTLCDTHRVTASAA